MYKLIDPLRKAPVVSTDKNFKIIAISDFHVGGEYGYLPHGCITKRKNKQPQTLDQERMEKGLITKLKQIGNIDVLLFLGDMIEGKNRKAAGLDITNGDTDIQRKWAIKALSNIINVVNPRICIGVTGSEYHVGLSSDALITEGLSILHEDIFFWHGMPTATFHLGDKLWQLTHTMTTSAGVSINAVLEREWKKLYLGNGRFGVRPPEVIGGGHIHQAQEASKIFHSENPAYGFVAPCQKLPDTFCNKNGKTFWDIGFLYLEQNGVDMWSRFYRTYNPLEFD